MSRDDDTLPEPTRFRLLRATHTIEAADDQFVRDALASSSSRARVLALRAALSRGQLSDHDLVVALTNPDSDVRREAASLCARRDASSDIVAALLVAMTDADPLVVVEAAYATGELGLSDAVDALETLATSHDDARVREFSVAALGSIGDPRSAAIVIACLADKPSVRRRAVVALTNFEGPDVDAALEVARSDKDWQTRSAVEQLDRGDDD